MKNTPKSHPFLPLSLPATAFLCLLTASCHKGLNRKVIIQGKVTEYSTEKPIADARIYVLCYDGPIFGSPSSTLADSILTGPDGRFYREYEDDELCNGVYLIPYKEGYFKGGEIDLTTNNEEHDVVLDPEAWLKIVTVPDLGMWQSLGFGGSISPHSVESFEGVQEQLFEYPGGREIVLHWGPFSNPSIIYSDSIFLNPHDTTIYTIHY